MWGAQESPDCVLKAVVGRHGGTEGNGAGGNESRGTLPGWHWRKVILASTVWRRNWGQAAE